MNSTIDSNNTPEGIAHHEAGHVVMAWIFKVPYESVTIESGDGFLGMVRGGSYLAPEPLDFSVSDPGERRRIARLLWHECLILISGIVAELHSSGISLDELVIPDTDDPKEDTALVRLYLRGIDQFESGKCAVDKDHYFRRQYFVQRQAATILTSPGLWPLVKEIAMALVEKRMLSKDDCSLYLNSGKYTHALASARSSLGL